MEPVSAREYFNRFNSILRENQIKVETSLFGGMMEVESINDGPVTFIIEKKIQTD
jgi:D-tyrosyl-tRNA(Tyr) deacylase